MSLFKNADGIYEADVRVVGVGRWHGSMSTRKKVEAEPRYAAVKRLFREAKGVAGIERRALIEQLRAGELSIDRLAAMVAAGEPLVPFVPIDAALEEGAHTWPTVDAAIERYIEWYQRNPNKRRATWQHAQSALTRFAEFVVDGIRVGDRRLDAVRAAMVEAYQQALLVENAAANTASAYIARVGALWAWVQRKEMQSASETRRVAVVIHSPLDREMMTRERSRRDRWLVDEEAERLVAVTPDRLCFVVCAGLLAGLRIGEILTLRTREDIDLDIGTITVASKQIGFDASGKAIWWHPKTRRSRRVVPIPADLRPILENQLARFASDQWVVPALEHEGVPFYYKTFNGHFNTIVANAGLVVGRKDPRGVVFHTLRHTFASWLVMSGQVDLYTVAQLLGDTLQVVEDTYAHLAPDFKRRAINAIQGKLAIPAAVAEAAEASVEPSSATADAAPLVESSATETATMEALQNA